MSLLLLIYPDLVAHAMIHPIHHTYTSLLHHLLHHLLLLLLLLLFIELSRSATMLLGVEVLVGCYDSKQCPRKAPRLASHTPINSLVNTNLTHPRSDHTLDTHSN